MAAMWEKPRQRWSFKRAQADFCPEGRAWAEKQPGLAAAWRTCKNGQWMAWWLFQYRGVGMLDISQHPRDGLGIFIGGPRHYRSPRTRARAQQAYADALRATFWSSGKRRVRRRGEKGISNG